MVAPGAHLEFGTSSAFKAKLQGKEDLAGEVVALLRRTPRAGSFIAGDAWTFEVLYQGATYALIYRRVGQRIGLVQLFNLPYEQQEHDAAVRALVEQHARGRKS